MVRILCAVLAGIGAGTAAAADPAEEVRCREIAFSVSAETRDAAAFSAFIDDDARFVGNDVARGPGEITAAWQPFFEAGGPAIQWRPMFVEVTGDGSLALSRGPYRMVFTGDDGERVERWGTYNSVWRRQADGEWKVLFDAGSAPIETPPEEVKALLDEPSNCD